MKPAFTFDEDELVGLAKMTLMVRYQLKTQLGRDPHTAEVRWNLRLKIGKAYQHMAQQTQLKLADRLIEMVEAAEAC